MLSQCFNNESHRRFFLTNRYVDAVHIGLFLGNDCIDTESSLTNLTIADNQLTLALANRSHRINRFGAGIHRLMDTLSGDNAGSQNLDLGGMLGIDRPLAVNWKTDTVNDAAFHFGSNRNLGNTTGALDNIAFLDTRNIAENGATDVVLFEVQGQAHDAARELEKLHGHAVLHPVDTGNTVTNRDNGSGLVEVNTGLVLTNLVLDNLTDFFGFDLHLFSPLNGTF